VTLLNFDTELDVQGVSAMVVQTSAPAITETVTIHQQPSQRVQYVGKPDSDWAWDDLRDYVVREIEQRFGVFPRDSKKEYGIFHAFCGRWGDQAPAIARFAFEVEDGRWAGAPISINRFCRNSDDYFASIIAKRIAEAEANKITVW
jgi:hypothetical protein